MPPWLACKLLQRYRQSLRLSSLLSPRRALQSPLLASAMPCAMSSEGYSDRTDFFRRQERRNDPAQTDPKASDLWRSLASAAVASLVRGIVLCPARLLLRPLVGSPFARLVTLRSGRSPEAYRVDAPIGLVAGYVDRAEGMPARGVPGHPPVSDSVFNCCDDLGR